MVMIIPCKIQQPRCRKKPQQTKESVKKFAGKPQTRKHACAFQVSGRDDWFVHDVVEYKNVIWLKKNKPKQRSEGTNGSSRFDPQKLVQGGWWDDRMDGWMMDGWLDDGAGLISERLGLMGSAAVGEIVQTRHVVCRKNMFGAPYGDKINRSNASRRWWMLLRQKTSDCGWCVWGGSLEKYILGEGEGSQVEGGRGRNPNNLD